MAAAACSCPLTLGFRCSEGSHTFGKNILLASDNGRLLQQSEQSSTGSLHENAEMREYVPKHSCRLVNLQGYNCQTELREEIEVSTMHVARTENPR